MIHISRNASNGENSKNCFWTWLSQLIKGVVTDVGKLYEKKRLRFSLLNTTNSRFVNPHQYYGHPVYINWIPWKTNKSLPEINSFYYGTCAIMDFRHLLGSRQHDFKVSTPFTVFLWSRTLAGFSCICLHFFQSIFYKIEKTRKRKQLPTVIMHSPLLSNRTQ